MKIDTQLKLSKTKYLLPCVILLLLAAILFGGGALLFIYSFVILAATSSTMIFFTIFASSFISIGLALAFSDLGDRFLQKYLHTYGDKNNPHKLMHEQKKPKTTVEKIFTFSNIYTTVLILGIIFTIICASLGALDHSNWTTATKNYKAENGYFESPMQFNLTFDAQDEDKPINSINIDLTDKNAVIIYYDPKDNTDDLYICAYQSFNQQIVPTFKDGKIELKENPSPRLNRVKDKMLFFMFDENDVAKQIQIYVPNALKGSIKITGNHILAK